MSHTFSMSGGVVFVLFQVLLSTSTVEILSIADRNDLIFDILYNQSIILDP